MLLLVVVFCCRLCGVGVGVVCLMSLLLLFVVANCYCRVVLWLCDVVFVWCYLLCVVDIICRLALCVVVCC